jgi:DNA-binding transcriptional MerR regulator
MDETTPTFNLKVVLRETGIKPDTLRAWERRYGLPEPDRTAGGHRLYSQRDMDIIKWLIARQDEGLSISRAVKLWRSLLAEGNDPLFVPAYQTADSTPSPTDTTPNLTEIRQRWIDACLKFDESTGERVLIQAFAIYPVAMVCTEVLQKGLSEIGELWYGNEASVQQEHFASALAVRRLNALIAVAPAPSRLGRVLVVCPSGEEHVFAPLLITLFLRYQGWDVIYLGANVPLSRLEAALESIKPNLVVLTAQQLHTAATSLEMGRLLANKGIPAAFGGLIFNLLPDLRLRIPGHFLGEQLVDAVQAVGKILTFNQPIPAVKSVGREYEQAAAAYRNHRPAIEAEVWQLMDSYNIPSEHISLANVNLSENIMAALQLGDMAYLGTEIDWIYQLLANHDLSQEWLQQYLNAYYEAADKHLNDNGRPIVNWLDGVRNQPTMS